MIGLGINIVGGQYGFIEPETRTYLNSLTTQLSGQRTSSINELIKKLKDELNINLLTDKFYFLNLYSNETQEAALKNIVQRLYDQTAINSPSWNTSGFLTGIAKYVNSNFNPSAQASLINFSLGVYTAGTVTNGVTEIFMGSSSTTTLNVTLLGWAYGGSSHVGAIGGSGSDADYSPPAANPNSYLSGLSVIATNGNRVHSFYRRGSKVGDSTTGDGSFFNGNIFVGSYNINGTPSAFSNQRIKISFAGKGLSASEISIINNLFEQYLSVFGEGL